MEPFEHNSTHGLPKEDRDRMASQNTGEVEPEGTAVDKPSSVSPGVSEEIAPSSTLAQLIDFTADFPSVDRMDSLISSTSDAERQGWTSNSYTVPRNPTSVTSDPSEAFASSSRQDQSRDVLNDLASVGEVFGNSDAVCLVTLRSRRMTY